MRKRFQSTRQTRRDFLKKTAVSAALAVSPFGSAIGQVQRVDDIGIQLYSLRSEMADDFEGTLEQLAEIGFTEMEFAGYHGRSPEDVRGILDGLGLTSPAAHIPLNSVRQNLEREIEIAATIGQQYIVDSFMVVVFGGVGNIWGTTLGAMTLGIANKVMEPWSGAVLGKILILVFIILFIQKRPSGMFALKGRAAEN